MPSNHRHQQQVLELLTPALTLRGKYAKNYEDGQYGISCQGFFYRLPELVAVTALETHVGTVPNAAEILDEIFGPTWPMLVSATNDSLVSTTKQFSASGRNSKSCADIRCQPWTIHPMSFAKDLQVIYEATPPVPQDTTLKSQSADFEELEDRYEEIMAERNERIGV
ncbi:hypothetical protein MMC14_008397 [Varicellaria rhodocarpa]|nr:hypothetical protein [Varicellaria rhodocarpa]